MNLLRFQMQFPAVPPAVIPGLTPGGLGANRGMRHFPGQPMFLLPDGFVKLLRLRLSSGKRVPLPSPPHPLGSPLRARNFGPTRESVSHLLAVRGR